MPRDGLTGSGQDRAPRRLSVLWGLTALCLLAIGASAGYAIYALQFGPCPPFLRTATARAPSPPGPTRARGGGPLRLAGSGSNVALTRLLVGAYQARSPRPSIVVHRSIGSGGAVRAVRDGVVDLGLVSRPLQEAERQLGLIVIPYARVAVIVAAHPSVAQEGLSRAELLAIFRGEQREWPDGSRLVLLLREAGDSGNLALEGWLPELVAARREAERRGLGRILYSDAEMQAALTNTEGAIGLFDLGALVSQNLAIKALALDGHKPSADNLGSGAYPVFKDLAFVAARRPEGPVAGLLRFVFSAEGEQTIRAAGYLPLGGQAP
ncbi:MAG: substrate-binding domain-containing protein [Deltaproteobacteria bacterium]|nr:substrate-binding domain-containing protein [Deltaproteobacteria bacterium]